MSFTDAPQQERRTEVARLLRHQYTEGQIAAQLGVTRRTVGRDVVALRAAWRQRREPDTDAWVDSELERLAVAERAVWPKVEAGNLFAIDRLLAIMDRRARYLGLDAPPARESNGHGDTAVNLTIQPIDYRAVIAPIFHPEPSPAALTAGSDVYRWPPGEDEDSGDGSALGENGPRR